ncbi:GGDEF domain-containing protein [Rhodococcus ruber]|uniref:GGDEF domain-containing protein n=1 Tax=Rhodococcus ruber TaxID=1830 RepID=A0ABT4MG88_9NOCA|nr:GGDEF domain-containing protein [Rhodococcus ruber]MCZ4519709.1 GGDEF domain-containing protein [Rhodococcus ruber]
MAFEWGAPHRYDFFPDYLVRRNLMTLARIAVVLATVVLGLQSLLFELGTDRSNSGAMVVAVGVAVVDVGWAALLWRSRPWFTETQSLCFVVTAVVFMTTTGLLVSIPLLGLAECTGFAVVCGYVVFFHGPRVFVAAITGAVSATIAIGIAELHDGVPPIQVAALGASVLIIIGAVPMMTLVIVGMMTLDVEDSEIDELTRTFNRRGLDREVRQSITSSDSAQSITVYLLDLDKFKSINDTYGHSAGDEVLVAVADALRRTEPAMTVARLGGEEFVVVDAATPAPSTAPEATAEGLRRAVREAATPVVTASIGVSGPMHTDSSSVDRTLRAAVAAADRAMYEAKRAGGDRAHHDSMS